MNFFLKFLSQSTINDAERQARCANVLYGRDRSLTHYFAEACELDHTLFHRIHLLPEQLERVFYSAKNHQDALLALLVLLEALQNERQLPDVYPGNRVLTETLIASLKASEDVSDDAMHRSIDRLQRYLYAIAPKLFELNTQDHQQKVLNELFDQGLLGWRLFLEREAMAHSGLNANYL